MPETDAITKALTAFPEDDERHWEVQAYLFNLLAHRAQEKADRIRRSRPNAERTSADLPAAVLVGDGTGTALPPVVEGCICSHTVHMDVPGTPVELNADADCPIHGEQAGPATAPDVEGVSA